jgi:hypothetical protein
MFYNVAVTNNLIYASVSPYTLWRAQLIGDFNSNINWLLLSQFWQLLYIICITVGHPDDGHRRNRHMSVDINIG